MSLETLILYGSAARDDLHAQSDFDLFGIAASPDYSMTVKNRVNLAVYPMMDAVQMAANGNLFMLHIVSEGQVVYDSKSNFVELKRTFKYKDHYEEEISDASDLGWALLKYCPIAENLTLINKRIAWCVRTILIAKAADDRLPIFAARKLADYANSNIVLDLIESKSSSELSEETLKKFKRFLHQFGAAMPSWMMLKNANECLRYFSLQNNIVAEKTMQGILSGVGDGGY